MLRLVDYADETHFAKVHGPGHYVVTGSMTPSLFWGEIELAAWRPHPYAVAAHITGAAPLPLLDSAVLLRGRLLEPVCAEMLRRDRPDISASLCRAYSLHLDVPLLASPDATIGDDGIVEFKVVGAGMFKERWREGPPLDVRIQHQAQYACTGAEHGIIGALVIGEYTFDFHAYDTEPHPGVMSMVEQRVADFVGKLKRGIWPDPDDAQHDSTARAMETMFPADKDAPPISINDPEATRRLDQWQQADLDKKAANAVIKSNKRWFLARAGKASTILVGNSGEITRKTYTIKAQAPRAATKATRWGLRDHSTDDDDDDN